MELEKIHRSLQQDHIYYFSPFTIAFASFHGRKAKNSYRPGKELVNILNLAEKSVRFSKIFYLIGDMMQNGIAKQGKMSSGITVKVAVALSHQAFERAP